MHKLRHGDLKQFHVRVSAGYDEYLVNTHGPTPESRYTLTQRGRYNYLIEKQIVVYQRTDGAIIDHDYLFLTYGRAPPRWLKAGPLPNTLTWTKTLQLSTPIAHQSNTLR